MQRTGLFVFLVSLTLLAGITAMAWTQSGESESEYPGLLEREMYSLGWETPEVEAFMLHARRLRFDSDEQRYAQMVVHALNLCRKSGAGLKPGEQAMFAQELTFKLKEMNQLGIKEKNMIGFSLGCGREVAASMKKGGEALRAADEEEISAMIRSRIRQRFRDECLSQNEEKLRKRYRFGDGADGQGIPAPGKQQPGPR